MGRFELEQVAASDGGDSITAQLFHSSRQDCATSSTRSCYDKQTGKKIIGLEPKGGEKAFAACLKNAAPNYYGTLTINTPKCDAEQFDYCYDGRSNTMLRKFEGQCTTSKPNPIDCSSIPFIEFVSGVEEGWDSPTINLGLRTIFHSKSGPLYIGGFQYVATGTLPSYQYVAKVFKSVDTVNWVGVALPNDNSLFGFIRRIIDGSNGALYAAGSWLWKSTDGGNTWLIISKSIADMTASASVQDVLQSKDGSLIALVYKTQPTYYNEVYKSYDGGKTWQLILGTIFQSNPSYNFIEADDGSLIFSTNNGDIYLYSNGALTKILTTDIYQGNLHFLKAKDGTIYFIAANPEKPSGPLVSYQSTDNGRNWIRTGELPYSSFFAWEAPIESPDGSIWAIANTPCWQSTIYKSSDRGVSWSAVATAPLNLDVKYDLVSFIGPKIMDIAESEGKIYSIPYSFGAVFSTP